MINKLPILVNTVLFSILLSSCKPMSLHMIGDEALSEQAIEIEFESDNSGNSEEIETEELNEVSILALLKEKNLLNNPNEALFWSLQNNHPDVAKWLIIKGKINMNVQDNYGRAPLHWAAYKGQTAVAELLINAGVQINEKDNYGYIPLNLAAEECHIAVAELLINVGAQVNEKDNESWTALHYAAEKGHIALAELLINAGADINAKEKKDYTPLHWAVDNGRTAVAELLINAGADVNMKDLYGRIPLHEAAFQVHTAAELLINANAQINEKDNYGYTSLHLAAGRNNVTFFELLSSLNINSNGRLVRLGALNKVEAFRKLLGSGLFDRNWLKFMLSYGDLNVNIGDNKGQTPLDIAREKGYAGIVKILEDIMSTYENQEEQT
jgi:ankyrin repeat protein